MSSNNASILPRTCIIAITIISTLVFAVASAAPPTVVIRIRTIDGIRRVPLPNDDTTSTLSSILASAGVALGDDDCANLKCRLDLDRSCAVQTSNGEVLDLSPNSADKHKTAAELGLTHGSMITIFSPPKSTSTDKSIIMTSTTTSNPRRRDEQHVNRYDPYPDLAKSKSYSTASRRARALSRGVSRGMTYGDISKVRSALHVVEPQSKGPLSRVYVCQVGAAKFQNHCLVKSNTTTNNKQQSTIARKKKKNDVDDVNSNMRVENRVALLFGTINKEAMDKGRNTKKARTSLSSPRSDELTCEVAKVHAVWEPPFQKPNGRNYDGDCLLSNYCTPESQKGEHSSPLPTTLTKETHTDRAIRIASWLGLHPIGWIFSYADEDRHEDGDALPVHGRDAVIGSKLQIETMKRRGREEGCKFVTLALDGRVGATEAFQLSDVCVQMVAEGVLPSSYPNNNIDANDEKSKSSTRFLALNDPVIVSGEETKQLDSVLLLVNMAMLSHVGMYSGGSNAPMGGNVKRNSGELLLKTRKRILSALTVDGNNIDNKSNGGGVLKELCDLDVLMALDLLIGKKDSEKLCKLVRNYARGQKKGTVLDDHLKLVLQTVLGG